jgi:hypothetical protein
MSLHNKFNLRIQLFVNVQKETVKISRVDENQEFSDTENELCKTLCGKILDTKESENKKRHIFSKLNPQENIIFRGDVLFTPAEQKIEIQEVNPFNGSSCDWEELYSYLDGKTFHILDDYSKDEIQQDISMGKDICDTPINVQPSKKKIPHRNPVRNISGNTKNLFQSTDRISSAPIQRDVDRAVQKTQKEESGTLLGDFTTPTTNLEEKVTELRAEFTLNVKEGTIHDCVVTNENLFSHEVEKEAATLNKCLKGKILYPKNAENQRMMTLEMEPVIAEAYIDNQEGVIRFYGVKPLNFDIYSI